MRMEKAYTRHRHSSLAISLLFPGSDKELRPPCITISLLFPAFDASTISGQSPNHLRPASVDIKRQHFRPVLEEMDNPPMGGGLECTSTSSGDVNSTEMQNTLGMFIPDLQIEWKLTVDMTFTSLEEALAGNADILKHPKMLEDGAIGIQRTNIRASNTDPWKELKQKETFQEVHHTNKCRGWQQ
ncbi:hypothetical protein ACLOJK_015489 [Asimina triloba]